MCALARHRLWVGIRGDAEVERGKGSTYIFHDTVPSADGIGAHTPRVTELFAHRAVPGVPATKRKPNRTAGRVERTAHFAVLVKGLWQCWAGESEGQGVVGGRVQRTKLRDGKPANDMTILDS